MIPNEVKNTLHEFNGGNPTKVLDSKVCEYIKNNVPLFTMNGNLYIYSNGVYKCDRELKMIRTLIKNCLFERFQTSTTIRRISDLFFMDLSVEKSFRDINKVPAPLAVPFRNGVFIPEGRCGKMIPHDPKYMLVNQIPFDYDPDAAPAETEYRKWIDWLSLPSDDMVMLFMFLGYCMTFDTKQQKFMIITGPGGTGKSTILYLLSEVLRDNKTHVDLCDITQRFILSDLDLKMCNISSENSIAYLSTVDRIKNMTGETETKIEEKFKGRHDAWLYVKHIFSTNSLPSLNDSTDALYRRLLILELNKKPDKVDPYLKDKLVPEIDAFIHDCMNALCMLNHQSVILESKNSKTAVANYRMNSDPVLCWLSDCTAPSEKGKIKTSDAYRSYQTYRIKQGYPHFTNQAFYGSLRDKGYKETTINGYKYFSGIELRDSNEDDIN